MSPRKARKSPDEMTFLEHLEDLRKRLFYSIIAILVAVIPGWIFSQKLYAILARPVTQYLPPGTKLAYTHLTAPFMLYMKVSFLAALFFTSPFVFYQLWMFVSPGLYQKEKKYVIPFVSFTTIFFLLGAVFGYFIVFPWACRFFLTLGKDFQPVITVDQYFSFAIKVLLGIAVVFELPTLVYFLSKIGLITPRWMIKNFQYAILVAFIVAAVITPTPDMITQSIVAVPMIALYGLSIVVALVVGKNKERQKRKEATAASENSGSDDLAG
ncbi:MAG: twin-arginine translocase subunit TatC [Candidatus Saccharicenans sp.]|nr:MAG: twin-arginine translocase subunit TatC [Candidatus Aminicenantes bacterium]HEK86276.1 twin-arginine translocase subunit TatC [Candidatus Aminicenantes bacterium]